MNKKTVIMMIAGVLLIVVGIFTAICLGTKSITLDMVYDSIINYENTLDKMLIVDVRIPRALASLLVGGILAVAGGAMQGVVKNPVAEPSVMGMTQGATLAVVMVNVFGWNIFSISNVLVNRTICAFLGAILGGILVLLFSMQTIKRMNIAKLLLAGTAMSTFFISLASVIAIAANRSNELAYWITGGLLNVTWYHVRMLAVIGSISVIGILILSQKINIINLGEDVAIGLGVNPSRIRLVVIILLMPLCAVCVASAGNIAYVGLMVPHIVRKVIGNDYRRLLPISFLWGGVLLVWADIAAKMINRPYETPIGLFTVIMGIPVFLFLARKERE